MAQDQNSKKEKKKNLWKISVSDQFPEILQIFHWIGMNSLYKQN